MTTSIVINHVLNHIINKVKHKHLVAQEHMGKHIIRPIYDPTLTLIRSWSRFKPLIENKFNPQGIIDKITEKPKIWTILSWNRAALSLNTTFNIKRFSFLAPVTNSNGSRVDSYQAKMVTLPLTIKFYCNDANTIEDIEEIMIVHFSQKDTLSLTAPILGEMNMSLSPLTSGNFEKPDTKTTGGIFELQYDIDISFLTFADDISNIPAILKVIAELRVGSQDLYQTDIGYIKDIKNKTLTIYRTEAERDQIIEQLRKP